MEGMIKNTSENQIRSEYSLRILVADDNFLNQKLMDIYLSRLGYKADFASDGEEAMGKLFQNVYEVVFLDLEMPLKTGFEVMNDLKTFTHKPFVIVVTAHTAPEIIEKAKSEGANFILNKPFSLTELQNVLNLCEANQKAFLAN
jgi:CheY-like chemotaxis protein